MTKHLRAAAVGLCLLGTGVSRPGAQSRQEAA